jgi:hypothetical protein
MHVGAKFAESALLLAVLVQSVAAAAHCFPQAPQNAAPLQQTASAPDSDCQTQSEMTAVFQSNTHKGLALGSAVVTIVAARISSTQNVGRNASVAAAPSAGEADIGLYALHRSFRI